MRSDIMAVKLGGIVLISCFLALSFLSDVSAEDQSKFLFKRVPVAKGNVLTPGEEKQVAELKGLKTTKDLFVAELNLDLFKSKTVTLNMSDNKALGAVTDSIEKRSDDDFTWFGKIPELSDTGSAVLVVKDGQMSGNVYAGPDVYQVVPLGSGRHAIIHVDQSKFPGDEGADPQKMRQIQKEIREKHGDKRSDLEDSDSLRGDAAARDDEIPEIKVMVLYTPVAKQKAGGKPQMEAQIQTAVDISNKSLQNSNIRLKFRLVHQFELNVQETGDIGQDLKGFVSRVNTPGDEVSRRRDKYRGDVGVMVISQCQKTPGTCGLAADIGAKPETAFCVVLLECMNNNLSFPHEIGHLIGARHNWEADPTGQTEHGSWFKGKDKKNHWRTIMCYPCPGGTCNRLPFWSNPEAKIEGISTGSPACCNNAALLSANAKRISQFR
jgi:hypothetical protein